MGFDCAELGDNGALRKGSDLCTTIAHHMREDGPWVDAGENDNVIVQQLTADAEAVGVFGYSFLDQNLDVIEPVSVNGVTPTFEAIASGEYPISRPLYFYAKKVNVEASPAAAGYIAEFTSEQAWGDEGYLTDKGLIPLPIAERLLAAQAARDLVAMTAEQGAALK